MPDFTECFGLRREGVLFFLLSSPLISDVDPKAIEIAADEFVDPVGNVECKQLVEKLGGTRRNRVFSFFGIDPPRRNAEAVLAEAEEKKQQKSAGCAGTTSALEKKKWRGKAAGESAPKRPKLLDSSAGSVRSFNSEML